MVGIGMVIRLAEHLLDDGGVLRFCGPDIRTVIASGNVAVLVDDVIDLSGVLSAGEVDLISIFGDVSGLIIEESRLVVTYSDGRTEVFDRTLRSCGDEDTVYRVLCPGDDTVQVGNEKVSVERLTGTFVTTTGHGKFVFDLGDVVPTVAKVLGTPEQTEVPVEYRWNNNKNHPILIAVCNGFVVWVVGEVIE